METYASNNPPTANVYTSSIPSIMLGVLSSDPDMLSLWMLSDSGEAISAERVSNQSSTVGRMYSPSSGLCWQATYSSTSGYGLWAQSETGPLGEHCGSVASATWYTQANALSIGATYTGAGTVSSGYMGILHMVHDSVRGMVFGGELDGRTLGSWLAKGKPVEGEIYVVSTSNAVETLIATTETAVQSQLYSTTIVDAGSVGGLTGSSAQALQTELRSFSTLWSHSATVAMAESQGFVEQRCQSSNESTAVYIAVAPYTFSSQPASAIQRFHSLSHIQLLMVCAALLRTLAYLFLTSKFIISFIFCCM